MQSGIVLPKHELSLLMAAAGMETCIAPFCTEERETGDCGLVALALGAARSYDTLRKKRFSTLTPVTVHSNGSNKVECW